MKFLPLNYSALALFATSVFFLSGCNNSDEAATPPADTEVIDTAPVEEELILPADSLGEGSEPKNSGPFGGAVQPEETPKE